MRKRSISEYMYLKKKIETKDRNMSWKVVVRPLISDKETIVLNDTGHILHEPQRVSIYYVFNACFNNIATRVGDDTGFNNANGMEDVGLRSI